MNNNKLVLDKLINSYWPAIIWSAIIFLLLALPGNDIPGESVFAGIPDFDKLIHFFIFAIWVILFCWGAIHHTKIHQRIIYFLLITLCGILFGYLMELVQKFFVPGRSYDLIDLLADSLGGIAGFTFSVLTLRKK